MVTSSDTATTLSHVVHVLLIDEHVDDVMRLRDALSLEDGFHVHSVRSLPDALQQLQVGRFDAVVVDYALWETDAGGLRTLLRQRHAESAIVLLTSEDGERQVITAIKAGASDFVGRDQIGDGPYVAARVLRAIEEHRALRRRDTMVRWLEREARTDHLTGLYNRRAFDERLTEACAEANGAHEPLALVLIDIVGTRTVNENHGHEEGDAMIRRTASGIAHAIRGGDFAARLGADDFAIIIPGGDIDVARRIARRVAHELERLDNDESDEHVPITVRFGVAAGVDCTPTDLFAAADEQLDQHHPHRAILALLRHGGDDDGPSVA